MYLDFHEDFYLTLEAFLIDHAGTALGDNATVAWGTLMGETGYPDDDNFMVIKVHGYYAIAKITEEHVPLEISNEVVPFDEDRIYPLQMIKKEITWD